MYNLVDYDAPKNIIGYKYKQNEIFWNHTDIQRLPSGGKAKDPRKHFHVYGNLKSTFKHNIHWRQPKKTLKLMILSSQKI